MEIHYKGKKKAGKKTWTKLINITQKKLERIIFEYFHDVCYNFYKRQFYIYMWLQHKYLRTSQVAVLDRRFIFKDINQIKKESTMNVVSAFEP